MIVDVERWAEPEGWLTDHVGVFGPPGRIPDELDDLDEDETDDA